MNDSIYKRCINDDVLISMRRRTAARRRVWRITHLYIGLFIGILFVFSGLTGSALVFYKAIDEFLNPALLVVKPEADVERLPLTQLIDAVQESVPAETRLIQLVLPRHSQATAIVRLSVPVVDGGGQMRVVVNPFTAEILAQREWGGYLMSFIYKLHYTLFLGKTGKTIIGILGLIFLVSLVSGIYLWWPKRSTFFQALTLKRSANNLRFIYNLHKTVGIYASVILVVIALTGIYMIFPQYIKPIVGFVSPLTKVTAAQFLIEAETERNKLNVDEISVIASNLFPKAELQRIRFPASVEGAYRITMRQPGDVRKTSGSTRIWIHPYNGKVLAVRTPQTMTGGDTFTNWMFPLHNGEAFGMTGRIVVFVVGLVPMFLYVTGLIIWWRKRIARTVNRVAK